MIMAISESTIQFTCPYDLEIGNYFITTPFVFAVRLFADSGAQKSKQGKANVYSGLIHGIGEQEKMRLRQYINEIYTRHKREERDQARQELEAANKSFLESQEAAESAEEGTEENSEESSESNSEESKE